MVRMHGLKCLRCPYYQGRIKLLCDPCVQCVMEKRLTHPFSDSGKIRAEQFCPVCGSPLKANGKCPFCRTVF